MMLIDRRVLSQEAVQQPIGRQSFIMKLSWLSFRQLWVNTSMHLEESCFAEGPPQAYLFFLTFFRTWEFPSFLWEVSFFYGANPSKNPCPEVPKGGRLWGTRFPGEEWGGQEENRIKGLTKKGGFASWMSGRPLLKKLRKTCWWNFGSKRKALGPSLPTRKHPCGPSIPPPPPPP